MLCTSCNKEIIDVNDVEKSVLVRISAFYSTKYNPNTLLPDFNSKIFIYNGKYSTDFTNYVFKDGVFTRGEKKILPDQVVSTDIHGEALIEFKCEDKIVTIFLESNYYKRISSESFFTRDEKISIVFNNYP